MMKQPVLNIMTYVLDDQEIVLRMIQKAFENLGITQYRMYKDCDALFKDTNEVHIAVIDYVLNNEEVNGLDVCKALLKKNPHCYVIIMSGQDSWAVLKDFMNSGARYYVEKVGNYALEVAAQVKEAAKGIKLDLEFYTMLVNKVNERE